MTKIINSSKAFHHKVKTLYDIEKQLENALPKMAEAAISPELAEGFLAHLEETVGHSERLEQIFELIDVAPEKHPGEAIRGLIMEASTIINTEAPSAVKDAMLAGAGRTVEHYEMACYMNAIEEAKALGYVDVVVLLKDTLQEELAADKLLVTALKKNLVTAAEEKEEME